MNGLQMRNRRRILNVLATLAILIACYLGFQSVEVSAVIDSLNVQIEEAQDLLDEDTAIYEALQQEREQMDTLEYIEKVAREKLGMVKSDDIVFKLK